MIPPAPSRPETLRAVIEDLRFAARISLDDVEALWQRMEEAAGKLESLLAGSQEPSGWQPIKTAPKDGTLVLLLCGPEYEVARWGRVERCWLGANRAVYPNAATLWLPLPASPSASTEQK